MDTYDGINVVATSKDTEGKSRIDLKDGKLEVLYTIIFTEHEHRDRIRSIGEFPEPITIIESSAVNGMENISSFRYIGPFKLLLSEFNS